jgi:hypothetical protein
MEAMLNFDTSMNLVVEIRTTEVEKYNLTIGASAEGGAYNVSS